MNQSVIDSLDVQNVTWFDRTDHELEAFLLLTIVVAGKNAKVQQEKLKAFLRPALGCCHLWGGPYGPFDFIRSLIDREAESVNTDRLLVRMVAHRLGQYRRLVRCFSEIVDLDTRHGLRRCGVHDLEEIHGIGPKTARYFLLHSLPDQQLAVLDTHILAWMKKVKKCKNVPKVTPGNRTKYRMWELRFLYFCGRLNKTPAELDLEIWNQRSKNGNAYQDTKAKIQTA